MRRLSGQAARFLAHAARICVTGLLSLTLVLAILLAGLIWRLSAGPLELTWLIAPIERLVNDADSPTRLSVGSVAMTWDGYKDGLDRPLEFVLLNLRVGDADGGRRLEIPRVELSVSTSQLALLRFRPRVIVMEDARLTVIRAPDGTLSLDLGSFIEAADRKTSDRLDHAGPELADLLAELSEPIPIVPRGEVWNQVRQVKLRRAGVTLRDHVLNTSWEMAGVDLELRRRSEGGLDVTLAASLALGTESVGLRVAGALSPGDGGARASLTTTPLSPAAIGRVAPGLASLERLDAPIALTADIALTRALRPITGALRVEIGAGQVRLADTPIALSAGGASLTMRDGGITLETLRLALRPPSATDTVTLTVAGHARQDGARFLAEGRMGFDRIDFTTLAALWPVQFAPSARAWLTDNITAGMARAGEVRVVLEGRDDFSTVTVTSLTGGFDGENLTVHWLRPIPPLEQARARVNFLDPDRIEILMPTARQKAGTRGGQMASAGGRMLLSGLTAETQLAAIQIDVTGSIANTIALLREPRLGLLDRAKIEFKDPAGEASVTVALRFPLLNTLKVDDIAIKANARMSGLRLVGLVAGRDIERGEIELEATNAGMTVKGQADLAKIAVRLDGLIDFQDGPPNQVQRRFTAQGTATAEQLAAAGIDGEDWVRGALTGTATWSDRRDGTGEVAIDADLTQAVLAVPPLDWTKPAGQAAKGSGRIVLARDRMRLIDRIAVDGAGLGFRGAAEVHNGKISALRIERAGFGRNDIRGVIRFPKGQPIAMTLSGPALDLSDKLTAKQPPPNRDGPRGQAWTIESQFDRVFLAHDLSASNVIGGAHFDGRLYAALRVGGRLGEAGAFQVEVAGSPGRRRFTANADDAGALLRGLDVITTVEGGTLSITGTFDDSQREFPLTGTARMTEFRVRGAIGFGKLLQAMTLYGLVDVLRGPGIGFSEMTAPFRLDDRRLTLENTRAFSPSLGLTTKGDILVREERLEMEGTIVPAYFFNSLLGNIPLVGRLFSPETGGGVFAARYTLRGSAQDPSVFVNPLSALTPGFLREIFGIF
jgi:hypothetical protein